MRSLTPKLAAGTAPGPEAGHSRAGLPNEEPARSGAPLVCSPRLLPLRTAFSIDSSLPYPLTATWPVPAPADGPNFAPGLCRQSVCCVPLVSRSCRLWCTCRALLPGRPHSFTGHWPRMGVLTRCAGAGCLVTDRAPLAGWESCAPDRQVSDPVQAVSWLLYVSLRAAVCSWPGCHY